MGFYSTTIKHLISAGVTGDALVTAIADIEESGKKPLSSSALRMRRYRERNELRNSDKSVTSDVTLRNGDETLYTKEERKKDKKESKNTASRFQLDALPSDWKEYCLLKRTDLDPEGTFEAFRDWWVAAPGGKGLKADWFATWRTWVRNQKGTQNAHFTSTNGANPNKDDRAKAASMRAAQALGIA
jgi:hypothetical protein